MNPRIVLQPVFITLTGVFLVLCCRPTPPKSSELPRTPPDQRRPAAATQCPRPLGEDYRENTLLKLGPDEWARALANEMAQDEKLGAVHISRTGNGKVSLRLTAECGERIRDELLLSYALGGLNTWTVQQRYLDADRRPDLVVSYHASEPSGQNRLGIVVALSASVSLINIYNSKEAEFLLNGPACWWKRSDGWSRVLSGSTNCRDKARMIQLTSSEPRVTPLEISLVAEGANREKIWKAIGQQPVVEPLWRGFPDCEVSAMDGSAVMESYDSDAALWKLCAIHLRPEPHNE